MPDIKLPLVGPVKRGWLIVFVAAGVAGGYYVYRRRAASPAAATTGPADTSGYGTAGMNSAYDPNAIDPATGLTYAEESGGGYYDPNTGSYVYPGATTTPGTGGTGAPATNAEWAQQVEAELAGVVDATQLAAAIGKYLTGQPLTQAQQSLADQAIAFGGYPPVAGPSGYPPALRSSPAGSGGGGNPGHGSTRVVTANGKQDLSEFAHAHKTTGGDLIKLKGNDWLEGYYGKTRKIPRGYKIRVNG